MQRVALISVLVMSGLLLSCSSSKKYPPGPKINIAVMDFEARAGIKAEEALAMRDAFASLLQQTGRFTVVDRSDTKKVLAEQEFQAAQEGEGNVAAMGKVLAVRKFVTGSVGKLGTDYIFNIKMTDVETAGVDFAISKMFNGDLEDIVEDLFPEFVEAMVHAVSGPKK
jgi:TolB-like protein